MILFEFIFDPTAPLQVLRMNCLSFVECLVNLRPRDACRGSMRTTSRNLFNLITLVQPDYSSPMEKLYEALVVSLLERTKNLDVFSYLKTDRHGNFLLPSLIPNSTIELSDEPVDVELRHWSQKYSLLDAYNACLGSEVECSAKPGVLCIRGRAFDIVRSVASGRLDGPESKRDDPNILDELLGIANTPPRQADLGQKKREEFWKAMCAGVLQKSYDRPARFDEIQSPEPLSAFYERITCLRIDRYEEFENNWTTFDLDHLKAIA
jgi:hypothetical protein